MKRLDQPVYNVYPYFPHRNINIPIYIKEWKQKIKEKLPQDIF